MLPVSAEVTVKRCCSMWEEIQKPEMEASGGIPGLASIYNTLKKMCKGVPIPTQQGCL